VPVLGLGIATQYAPARDVMLVFVVVVAASAVLAVRAVLTEVRGSVRSKV
jgi:hypothetical protein